MSDDPREQLRRLLSEQAVLRGDFVLSSGQRSSYYLDARLVTLSAAGSGLIGEIFCDLLSGEAVDGVAGLTLGADPMVSAIATTSYRRGTPLDGFIVRKERKDHGAGRRIEGPWRTGLHVAVVDDTLTTGTSALEAATAVQEEGGTVAGVWAIVDREAGAREAIEKAGYRYSSLFTIGLLLD